MKAVSWKCTVFYIVKITMTFCNEIHLGILNPTMVDKLLIIYEGPKATFYHDILYLLKLNKLIIVYFYSDRTVRLEFVKKKTKNIFFINKNQQRLPELTYVISRSFSRSSYRPNGPDDTHSGVNGLHSSSDSSDCAPYSPGKPPETPPPPTFWWFDGQQTNQQEDSEVAEFELNMN